MATKKAAKTTKTSSTKSKSAATKSTSVKRSAAKVAKKATATSKKAAAKKTSPKRELIAPRGDKRYIRRDERGRIIESDDVGRSLSQDVRKSAKTKVPAGMGDRGDQKRRK